MEEMREICLEAVLPTETSTVSLSPRASAENLHFFPVNSIVAIFAPSVDGGEMEERRKIVLEAKLPKGTSTVAGLIALIPEYAGFSKVILNFQFPYNLHYLYFFLGSLGFTYSVNKKWLEPFSFRSKPLQIERPPSKVPCTGK